MHDFWSICNFLTSDISALSHTSAMNEALNAGQAAESPLKVPTSGTRSASTLTIVPVPVELKNAISLAFLLFSIVFLIDCTLLCKPTPLTQRWTHDRFAL